MKIRNFYTVDLVVQVVVVCLENSMFLDEVCCTCTTTGIASTAVAIYYLVLGGKKREDGDLVGRKDG